MENKNKEGDLWPRVKNLILHFKYLENKSYSDANSQIEKKREKSINVLMNLGIKEGVNFFITPEINANLIGFSSNDIWGYTTRVDERGHFIQIPRYSVEKSISPEEIKRGELKFRNEIPAAFILVNMAHEIAHFMRKKENPDNYDKIFKGNSPVGQAHTIFFTKKMLQEEMETDIKAFSLLKNLDIPGSLPFQKTKTPITPEIFVGQIPENGQAPTYREELLRRLLSKE